MLTRAKKHPCTCVQPDFQTFCWYCRTTMDFLCQAQLRGAATTQPNLLPRISNQYWKPSKISCSKNIFWPSPGNIGWWPNIMDACLNMPWAAKILHCHQLDLSITLFLLFAVYVIPPYESKVFSCQNNMHIYTSAVTMLPITSTYINVTSLVENLPAVLTEDTL